MEEQSEKAESFVERIYKMKYSRKGHKDRKRHKNGIKRSRQARFVYVIGQSHHHSEHNAYGVCFFVLPVTSSRKW